LPSAINSLLLQPDSGLLAVTCDDLTVRIVDLETRRVVREYSGFRGRILDVVGVDSVSSHQRSVESAPDIFSRFSLASSGFA